MNCFVATISTTLAEKMKSDLEGMGFTFQTPNYTIFQAKKTGVSCTLYTSGKLTVQGKDKDEFIRFYLEPNILGNLSYSHPELDQNLSPHIGSDEAGKGDFFGPLVIASMYCDEPAIKALLKLGIMDSKRMSDDKIVKLAIKLKAYPHSIIRLYPTKYNELYGKFKNLNRLMAWAHAAAMSEVVEKTGCKDVLLDKFADDALVENQIERKGLAINLTQRVRAEEDIVVAGASILARAAFVDGIDKLSKEMKIELPKGASGRVVEAGRKLVAMYSPDVLSKVGKLHFKTREDILT
ncbi:MAG: Ribonuclease HIII [Chlamydiia bacterium]|nr:Ribonuclease HIII [Chlamydiia bacterium]MCH9615554.1 Ribonuclease HIII [Chlamydiia bacterium]MCH9629209.1 Ribonuclease HIII [Chlamydiia bacterium]